MVLGFPMKWGLGYNVESRLVDAVAGSRVAWWAGGAGSLAFVDLDCRMAFGYARNRWVRGAHEQTDIRNEWWDDDASSIRYRLGELVDQAALHGVLLKVRDLELSLVSVQRVLTHVTKMTTAKHCRGAATDGGCHVGLCSSRE
jgi:hypothetical protein